ncbi:MAG: hypothetical protein JNL94_06305, partial [Planctomycetes bacterium]|nr:hypothetical protein [Planctomycetota bacterium]
MLGVSWSPSLGDASCVTLICSAFAVWVFALRRTLRRRHDVVVAALAVGAVTVIGLHVASLAERDEAARRFTMLTAFAETYALDFEDAGHGRLPAIVDPNDPTYLALIEIQKRWLAKNSLIADVYTFRKRADGSIVLVVDSETDYDGDGAYVGDRERRTTPGEAYSSVDPALTAAFDGRTSITPEPVTDRWGTWYSVFVPMVDANGAIEAVLGIDTSAAEFDASVAGMRTARIGALLAVLVGLFAAFSVIGLLRARLDEREAFEASLDEARRTAETASRAKSAFLTNMSHELRTPMNGIVGMATLLLDAPMLGEHRGHLETIRGSGEQLLTLLQDMIDLAAIEGGKFDPAIGPFDPTASVKTILALFHTDCIDRGLDLRVDVGDGVP